MRRCHKGEIFLQHHADMRIARQIAEYMLQGATYLATLRKMEVTSLLFRQLTTQFFFLVKVDLLSLFRKLQDERW